MNEKTISAKQIRKIILEQSRRAHVGHIGSCLSITDIIAALYSGTMEVSDPGDLDRDRLILSKGHAALALYAALYLRGWISEDDLNKFHGNGTLLGVHPEHHLKGIDFSTGSLGQGLSMAVGAALATRLQDSKRRIFALISDAECNEGTIWEAAMFAAHHRLSNLIVILDFNNQQALGYSEEVLSLKPIEARWQTFGWDVHPIDGHDSEAISRTIETLDVTNGAPHILIAYTTFGKGVSYMESQIKWHYWPMSDEEYTQAVQEIEASL